MKPYEAHENIPTLNLSVADLHVVDTIIQGYLSYLHGGVQPSPKQESDLALLKAIRRLASTLADDGGCILFTAQELQVLADAMLGFVEATTRVVAQSPERDEVLTPILSIRQHLLAMLSAAYS